MPEPSQSELSIELRDALIRLGDSGGPDAIPDHCMAELLLLDLIEWHSSGIRFTEPGRRIFHEVRGASRSA